MHLSWSHVRDAVVPLLARRSSPPLLEEPVVVHLEPGLPVGFGVDLGPAFVHVTALLLRQWRVSEDEVARRALANLRVQARRLDAGIATRGRVGVTLLTALQVPAGWGSSLLLAPDLLPRWIGRGSSVLVAPARNLLVALPPQTDHRRVRWLRDVIAAQLPHPLDVPALAFDGARLMAIERAVGHTPHAQPPPGAQPPPDAGHPASAGSARSGRCGRPLVRPWRARAQGAPTTWYNPPPDRSVR